MKEIRGTIGGTSRATFGILAELLNITVYPILCQRYIFLNITAQRIFFQLFQL